MVYLRILILLALAVFVGCPAGEESVDVQPTQSPAAQNAKTILEGAAESGELGSAAMELRESLEGSEEGKALLPDMDALEAMTNPEEIKAKAKEMADKL